MNLRKMYKKHAVVLALASLMLVPATASATVVAPSNGGNALLHAVGWQEFEPQVSGDNNSGIDDGTVDSNSTFDSTPFGSHLAVTGGGVYLSGGIGVSSGSSLAREGYGQSTNAGFLQGPTYGDSAVPNGMNIVDVPDADGTFPGTQLNINGVNGSSWKFRTNGNQEFGDFSITNHSDFDFRLERIHFDARAGNANSPVDLDIIYLATGSNLLRRDNDLEVANNAIIDAINFATQPSVQNVSASIAAALSPSTAAYLPPGDSAIFRFRWTNALTTSAESQIDNLAFSGTFQDQNNGNALINPATVVPEPASLSLLAFGALLIASRRRTNA